MFNQKHILRSSRVFVICSIIFHFTAPQKVNGQNYIYQGKDTYEATQIWTFKLTNYHFPTDLEMSVANKRGSGLLMLALEVPFEEAIAGNIFLILENGTTITLGTKTASDRVDGKTQVLYAINVQQLSILKNHSISKIRFSLRIPKNTFGGVAGNYTATNNRHSFTIVLDPTLPREPTTWDTAYDISILFK